MSVWDKSLPTIEVRCIKWFSAHALPRLIDVTGVFLAFVFNCFAFLFQCSIRRTAVKRCPSPAALITRPSSTVLSAHPMAWAPLRHPALPLGQPQTRAQRGRSQTRPRPLTPSQLRADQDSRWLLSFLAAMLTWGGKKILHVSSVWRELIIKFISFVVTCILSNVVKRQGVTLYQPWPRLYWMSNYCSFFLLSIHVYLLHIHELCDIGTLK